MKLQSGETTPKRVCLTEYGQGDATDYEGQSDLRGEDPPRRQKPVLVQ